MNFERTLLERIDSGESDNVRLELDHHILADSILINIVNVLNTRRGNAIAQPRLGMPDLNDLVRFFPNTLGEITQSIAENITLYEPRVSREKISIDQIIDEHDPFHLKFEVKLNVKAIDCLMVFRLVIVDSGRMMGQLRFVKKN